MIRTEQDDGSSCTGDLVQDAGVGFLPQDADRLFDAFYIDQEITVWASACRSVARIIESQRWAP